jgi:hypothetical protein
MRHACLFVVVLLMCLAVSAQEKPCEVLCAGVHVGPLMSTVCEFRLTIHCGRLATAGTMPCLPFGR